MKKFSNVSTKKVSIVDNSTAKLKMCIQILFEQGILATPDYSRTGELQTLNMKLRNELDLFANVVHVRSLPGVKTRHNVSQQTNNIFAHCST